MNKDKRIETPEDVKKKVFEIWQRHNDPQTEEDKWKNIHWHKLRYLSKKYGDRFTVLGVAFEQCRKEFYLNEQRGEIASILKDIGRTLGVKERYMWDYIGSCQARIERVFEEFTHTVDLGWKQYFFSKIESIHSEIINGLLKVMCKDCLERIEENPLPFIDKGLAGVSEYYDEMFKERDEALEKIKKERIKQTKEKTNELRKKHQEKS